ncbi:hypothetical protein Vadar_033124 [Vaccinium darrowii]|uniref:Uncharacterized protein n=1 Tax=Vaccinium darrowii TaxID=229202 RepID=A0ACB7XE06_9ERIC|nr:hypothetical protein Vadar_033124 [Vaccinium darrowii]
MAASSTLLKLISIFFILIPQVVLSATPEKCSSESGDCINKSKALPLKIIAIAAILVTSMVGVCLPLVTRSVPALSPDRNVFVIVKCFAAGIILGTGFMHVLPDSFDMLTSGCLPEKPWHVFPFTGFVAMLSAIGTLMVDSMATSVYSRKNGTGGVVLPENTEVAQSAVEGDRDVRARGGGAIMGTTTNVGPKKDPMAHNCYVLELGIIVHSVVIGLSMGASNNTCTIKPLVAALCFHQMFEGIGLGGCILQAEYKVLKKAVMAFFFSVTTPFGVVLGIALSNTYKENSPTALITIGILNASSAGLLIYMALVDLLSSDFMGPKLQGSIKLQIKSYAAVLLGAGGMSLLAIWA